MKKIIFVLLLLTSVMVIGQKNNFYGETGNQIYKIKIPLKIFNSLDKTKSTIELGSNDEDEEIMVKIFASYTYKNGVLTLSKIKSIRPDMVWNNTQKNNKLNKYFDDVVRAYLKKY
ncbi:hypothetical protein ACM55K_00610 [Flavobacterium sp. LT1R49]|uniref:hypothetical protein n=1 Tax=Flavobacterium arabinosi TaxID=3398737 RepID=UPI003A8A75C9